MGAVVLLGMVGSSTLQVFTGLALSFVILLFVSKLLLHRFNAKGGAKMKKKRAYTQITTLTRTATEVFYDFSVSFGAGYLGATVPSIAPSQLDS